MKAKGDVQGAMPVWVQPVILKHWPTRIIASNELHYQVPVKESWQPAAGHIENVGFQEHSFRGDFITDWLVIALLDTQGSAGELVNWVEGPLSLVKFPNPTILQALSSTPRLLAWPLTRPRHWPVPNQFPRVFRDSGTTCERPSFRLCLSSIRIFCCMKFSIL